MEPKKAVSSPGGTGDKKEDRLDRVQQGVRQRLEKWLKNTPYRFNPDTSTVDTIIKGLALRKLKYGEEYCPCRVVNNEDKGKNKGIISPCIYHEEEIARGGICFCGLFVGTNYNPEWGRIAIRPYLLLFFSSSFIFVVTS